MNPIDDFLNFLFGKLKFPYTGGKTSYHVFKLDLTKARDNERIPFDGNRMIVQRIDSRAYARIDDRESNDIDISITRNIRMPFKEFYITNEAQHGELHLLCGTHGIFDAINPDPSISADAFGNVNQINLSELSARLGSLTNWDRTGNLIWFEDWENNVITWSQSTAGVGSALSIGTTERYTGTYSLTMLATAGIGNYAKINRGVDVPPDGKIGLEVAFQPSMQNHYFNVGIDVDNGINRYKGAISYDSSDGSVDYWNSGGTWTKLAGTKRISPQFHSFSHFKMIIDNTTGKYVRAKLGSKEWDMSDIAMQSLATQLYQLCLLTIKHENNNAGFSAIAHLDNVIYTINEV